MSRARRRLRRASLVGLLLLAPIVPVRIAGAEPPPAWASEPLSLERCLELALGDEVTQKALQARVRAAEALRVQAAAVPNPLVSYTAQDLGLHTPSGPALLHQPMLSFPPFYAYLRSQEARVARAAVAQVTAATDEDRRQLRLTVGRAYHDAVLSARLATIDEAAVALAAELVAQTQRRVAHGDTGTHEVSRALAEALEVRRSAELSARRRDLDALALSVLLGAQPPFPIRLPPLPPDPAAEPDPPPPQAQRPDLRMARAQLERATEQRRLEARRVVPLSDVQLAVGARVMALGVGGVVVVSAPLPLFDHNAGPRAAALAQLEAAQATLAQTERQAALEIATARRERDGAREALVQLARPLVRLREQTLTGTQRQFTEGVATLLELVTAQRDLLAAQRGLAQAERDAALATLRLRLAVRGE